MKCPKTCLFVKYVEYTMIFHPPFKEGHARFPMVTCIPLSDWWYKNSSVFLSCKCMLDMPLHKWKVTWNYVSSPFKTHKSIAKNFHSQKLKIVKNNNFITSLYCIIHILLHINNTKVNNTTGWVNIFFHGSCFRMKNTKVSM